ncbi:hypothetical protein N7326_02420 [Corynebacterium sp. ES2794-CONJ1]|uniref:hypothetical protein n=1 Tax=unclassified Corynebacterium TaxID=2624378 RepID=UPI00216ABB9B|nr:MULTISPECIES: hypothetical protein [unclassified Corynebacterium]MCS4531340.1 hypothetical protein [Corynebacterium sp. ES2730-CONJ]MCU9518728.1 hypothetical protein [Corynebacterium sp. ES2794-CONJ1]
MVTTNADRLIYIRELVRIYTDVSYFGDTTENQESLSTVLGELQDAVETQLLDAGLMEMHPAPVEVNGTRPLLPTGRDTYTTGMPVYSTTNTGGLRLNNPARLTSIQGGE